MTNLKCDGYQYGLPSMVYKFFDKKCALLADKSTPSSGIKNENISNKELDEELCKPIITKFNKRKLHSCFIGIIWGADLVDMRLVSKLNKRIRILLKVIDIFHKYPLVLPFKDKRGITILMLFKKFLMNLIVNQSKFG